MHIASLCFLSACFQVGIARPRFLDWYGDLNQRRETGCAVNCLGFLGAGRVSYMDLMMISLFLVI